MAIDLNRIELDWHWGYHASEEDLRNMGKCVTWAQNTWWHDDVIKWKHFPHYWPFVRGRPVTQSFDVFFDLRLNKRLRKQLWGWWFETVSHSAWRHCNDITKNKALHKVHGTYCVYSFSKWYSHFSHETPKLKPPAIGLDECNPIQHPFKITHGTTVQECKPTLIFDKSH